MNTTNTLVAQLRKGDTITDGTTVAVILTTPMVPKRKPGHLSFLVGANGTNYNVTLPDTDRIAVVDTTTTTTDTTDTTTTEGTTTMTTTTLHTFTINLPGVFLSHFEGSGVGQGQPHHGYEGCDDLGALIKEAPHKRRGRGYFVTIEATAHHLVCLFDQADMMVEGCDYGEGSNVERTAGNTVMQRCREGLQSLGRIDLLG